MPGAQGECWVFFSLRRRNFQEVVFKNCETGKEAGHRLSTCFMVWNRLQKKTACPSDSLLQTSLLRESQMRCPFAERNVNPGPGVNAVKWNQNLVFGEFGEKRLIHFKHRESNPQ